MHDTLLSLNAERLYMSLSCLKVDYTFLSDYVFCQERFNNLRGQRDLFDRKFDSRYPLP